jgi:hypothetical protein
MARTLNHPTEQAPPAEHQHRARLRAQLRAWIALALLVLWAVALLTGFLLYLAPIGPRSGQLVLLWLTKREWGDVHFWASLMASMVTVVHLVVDWKAFSACVRFLGSTKRQGAPC